MNDIGPLLEQKYTFDKKPKPKKRMLSSRKKKSRKTANTTASTKATLAQERFGSRPPQGQKRSRTLTAKDHASDFIQDEKRNELRLKMASSKKAEEKSTKGPEGGMSATSPPTSPASACSNSSSETEQIIKRENEQSPGETKEYTLENVDEGCAHIFAFPPN